VAYNQYVNAGSHAFGWYCLFVAITAVPAGIFTFANADGSDASIYLGFCWFAWAVLWFLFWLLLATERPITKLTGWLAILEGDRNGVGLRDLAAGGCDRVLKHSAVVHQEKEELAWPSNSHR
jgi:hypothetical protein